MRLTHVSLFTGIGGLDLAAEAAGFETVLQVEREPFPLRVLEKHWPNVPRITDVREVTSESVSGHVTVVSGGFPCQPFSAAGKRRGADDDRYLWPELLRIVEELRPSWVVGENVSGLLSIRDGMEIDDMLASLEARNYTPWILHYPAAGVGAYHKRDRVFIVAHSRERERIAGTEIEGVLRTLSENGTVNNHADRSGAAYTGNVADAEGGRSQRQHEAGRNGEGEAEGVYAKPTGGSREQTMADATQQLRDGSGGTRRRRDEHSDGGEDVAHAGGAGRKEWNAATVTERPGHDPRSDAQARGDGATEPCMGRMADEFSNRMDGGGLDEEISNQKAESETREFEREAMRALWEYRESTTAPSELRIGRLYSLVPDVPHEIARRAWYMGKWAEKDEKLRGMWEGVHSASQQEAQDLLERMSERVRASKRNEAMAWGNEPRGVPRVATGVKDRAARLKALGNAVVPAQAYPIFVAIAHTLRA